MEIISKETIVKLAEKTFTENLKDLCITKLVKFALI